MKKFFVYELKKSLYAIATLALIATIIYVVTILLNFEGMSEGRRPPLGMISVIGAILAFSVPVWKLGYRMNKRSVDLYYSVPLSHTALLVVKLLVGLIAVFVPYIIAFWIGAFTMMGTVGGTIRCVYLVPFFFASIVPILIFYTIGSFAFSRANSTLDGIAFMALICFSLGMITFTVSMFVTLVGGEYLWVRSYCYLPWSSLARLTEEYEMRCIYPARTIYGTAETVNMIVGYSLTTAGAIAAGVGMILSERRAKAENCEQISDSPFGYKYLLPVYAFCSSFCLVFDSILFVVLIAVALYAAAGWYKRTLKIGWKYSIALAAPYIAGILIRLLLPR